MKPLIEKSLNIQNGPTEYQIMYFKNNSAECHNPRDHYATIWGMGRGSF